MSRHHEIFNLKYVAAAAGLRCVVRSEARQTMRVPGADSGGTAGARGKDLARAQFCATSAKITKIVQH